MFASYSITVFFLALLSLFTLATAAPVPSSSSGLTFVHDVTIEDWTRNAAAPIDVSERRQAEEGEDFVEYASSEELRLEKELALALIPLQTSASDLSNSAQDLTTSIKSPFHLTSSSSPSFPSSVSPTSTAIITSLLSSLSSPFQKRLQPFLSFPPSSSSSPSSHNLPVYIEALSSSEREGDMVVEMVTRRGSMKKRLVPFFSFQGARVAKVMGGELERERVEEVL